MAAEVQAGELRDADIHFISLVDKAANKRRFKRMVFKSADAPDMEPEPDSGTLRRLWQTLKGFFQPQQVDVAKVGRKMAKERLAKLTQAIQLLQEILAEVQDNPEDEEASAMDRDAVQRLLDEAVAKAVAPLKERIERLEAASQAQEAAPETKGEPLTAEAVSQMVEQAVAKAVKPLEERLSVVEKARLSNAAQVDVSKGQVDANFWGGVFLG